MMPTSEPMETGTATARAAVPIAIALIAFVMTTVYALVHPLVNSR